MSGIFRDTCIIARHDLQDSFRSRRVIVWLTLYLAGAIGSCSIFIFVLHQIETEVARLASLGESSRTGAMTQTLWETKSFKNIVTGLVGDKDLADKLVRTPPLALFYGWLSLTFAPFLVILLSSESISTEVSSGSIRFALFRTSRIAFSIGKTAGQTILLAAALLLSAAGALISGWIGLSHFEAGRTLIAILELILKTWIFCLAYIGLAAGVSQAVKSVQLSRGVGIMMYFMLAILASVADHFSGPDSARLWELVLILTPQGHRLDFWRPDWYSFLNASSFSLGLGILYFMCGFSIFSKRDL